jgi:DNA repair exonuclease SbcCD nuclease subunit
MPLTTAALKHNVVPTGLPPVAARFVVTADWHIEQYRNLAKEGEDFLTSRAKDIRDSIRFMGRYMKENGILTMIHGGDVFHKQDEIEVPIYNLAYDELKALHEAGLVVHILKGNHDEANKTPDLTCLRPLSEVAASLVIKARSLRINGVWFFFIPYETVAEFDRDLEALLGSADYRAPGPKVLVAHIGISEARFNESYTASKHAETTAAGLHSDKFSLVLLGHYHMYQKVGSNIYYPGAPLQHDFGDRGQARGFLDITVYQDGTSDVVFVPIPGTPRFHYVPVAEYDPEDYPLTDFIKLSGASLAQQQALKDDPRIRGVKDIAMDETQVRVDIGLGASWEEAITKYVDFVCPEAENRTRLIDYGTRLLKGENA